MGLKIVIIRNDNIGDLVLSTPVFRELKKSLPSCKICLVVSKVTKSLIEKNKNIDNILQLEPPKKTFKSLWNYLKTVFKIRKMNYDIGIDLRGSLANAVLLWLSGLKKRIGKCDNNKKKIMNKAVSLFLTNPIKTGYYTTNTHITKENLMIINQGLKLKTRNNFPEIITDQQDKDDVNKFLKSNNLKKYICLCPISSLDWKQWDIKYWQEIINWLKKYRIPILLLGTKNDQDILNKLATFNPRCKVALNFDLRKMAILFKKSKLVIAHDGGPMHIAWASKAKLIELVPKFYPELGGGKFAPLNKNSILLWAEKNMHSIKVKEVKKAIAKML